MLFGRICCFWVNFFWFKAVLNDFDQKWVFCNRRFCIWSRKSPPSGFPHFVAVFDVFNLVLIFMVFDTFGRLWGSFDWLKAVLHKLWNNCLKLRFLRYFLMKTIFKRFYIFLLFFNGFLIDFWNLCFWAVIFEFKLLVRARIKVRG